MTDLQRLAAQLREFAAQTDDRRLAAAAQLLDPRGAGRPEVDDAGALELMAELVADGAGPYSAAGAVAERLGVADHNREAFCKRLTRKLKLAEAADAAAATKVALNQG